MPIISRKVFDGPLRVLLVSRDSCCWTVADPGGVATSVVTCSSTLAAQTKAITQPISVQPKNRFKTRTASRFFRFLLYAHMAGKKYTNSPNRMKIIAGILFPFCWRGQHKAPLQRPYGPCPFGHDTRRVLETGFHIFLWLTSPCQRFPVGLGINC